LNEFAGQFDVWPQAVHKKFKKPGIARKKTFTRSEKSEKLREVYLKKTPHIPKKNRVYVDECGIKEHLKRGYG
jgi:hypothetical protein